MGEGGTIMTNLTIVVPVKEPPEVIDEFIEGNIDILSNYPMIVIDSGGGEKLRKMATKYVPINFSMTDARRVGGQIVETKYVLHLDSDTILPKNYVRDALKILESDEKVVVVAIEYEKIQGHLALGTSIWRTEVFNKLYDFSFDKAVDGTIVKVGENIFATLDNGWCECSYMWRILKNRGYKMETLCYRAKHLKGKSI